MSVRKSDVFIADIEKQFEWYAQNARLEIAERYLDAVEATCNLLGQYPQLGPLARLTHPQLREWRFFVIFRPFQKHILFYEATDAQVTMRRVMHGHRDLPKRLLENP
jgi:plasmid stabilization system protein ParE